MISSLQEVTSRLETSNIASVVFPIENGTYCGSHVAKKRECACTLVTHPKIILLWCYMLWCLLHNAGCIYSNFNVEFDAELKLGCLFGTRWYRELRTFWGERNGAGGRGGGGGGASYKLVGTLLKIAFREKSIAKCIDWLPIMFERL